MPQSLIENRYYPRLISLLGNRQIPRGLNNIKGTIDKIFGNLYYKDLVFQTSASRAEGYCSLSIISPERINFEVPEI